MENEAIKAANLAVELQYLLQAIPERAAELSTLLKEIEKVKAVHEQILHSNSDIVKASDKEKEVIAVDRNNLQVQKSTMELDKLDWNKKLSDIKLEVKEANRELRWVNDKIFKGNDEVSQLTKKTDNLQKIIDEMILLIAKKEELKEQVTLLDTQKQTIISEMSDVARTTDEKVAKAQLQFTTLEENTRLKVAEMSDAEFKLKSYTDQLYTNMNDYMVIKTRLETVWQRTFPELELPLN